MTAKRFINDIDNGKLIDTKGELSIIYYSDSVDFFELWEFLNKLNDENEQLKYNLSAHMVDLNNYKGKCSALEIENEQLKKAIDEADDLIKSHLSAHYNRKWENICEYLGVDLND